MSKFLRTIFSIEKVGTHKVITIFGLKFKFFSQRLAFANIEKQLDDLKFNVINIEKAFGLQNYKYMPTFDIMRLSYLIAGVESANFVIKNLNKAKIFKNRLEMLKYALSLSNNNGLYLEFGVYAGESINYLSQEEPNITFYGFDSFEGLPEDWRSGNLKGRFQIDSLPEVNSNVRLIKGWFDESLPKFLEENSDNVSFIHIDSDLYTSARTIFQFLKNRIKSGTILVFDEFFNYPGYQNHEYKAFFEYVEENGIKYEYIGYVPSQYQVIIRIC